MIDFTIIVRRTQGAFWIFLLGCLTACGGGEPSSDDTKLWPAPETAVFAPPEFLVSLAQTRLTQSAGPLQATPVVAMAHRTLTLGAAPSQATPAVALAMANQFFDLVELRFPDIFQSRSTTQTEGEWVFRAYFRVGIMVGVNTGQIYVYGGIFGPQLRLVGSLSNFVAEPSGTVLVSGLVSKGPLVGSTVCAYAITNSAKGVQLGACATTGSDGRYNVDLGSYAGAVLLEATSGIYVDEATGSTVSLSTPLRSMLTSVSGTTDSAAITPLTDLAYQMAMAAGGSLSASRMQSAIASVQSNFGVADIVRTMPANALNVAASSTSAEKIYALALATLSQYQKSRPAGTTINAVVQTLNTCISSPSTGCGSGSSSVGAALAAAQNAFAATHSAFADVALTVANFGALTGDAASMSLSVSPAALTFAAQAPGTTSAAQTITLANTGSSALTNFVLQFYFPSDFIQSSNCGTTLAAGATCAISVSFSPRTYSSDGLTSTKATVVNVSSTKGAMTIGLYGLVPSLPKPALQITPASLSFGAQAFGVASAPKTVTLTNTGLAPLDFTCIETPPIDGASNCYVFHPDQLTLPRDYAQTSTCTFNASLVYPMTETAPYIVQPKANLAPGASCTVSVVFTPSAGGARSGALIIDSNASNGGNGLVPLTGNGGADALGTGTFSGVVLDAVTNGGIAGILINIYSGTTLVSSVTSDANGVFSSTVPVGTYKLVMSKSGYVTATINSASLQKDVTTTTETVLQVSSNNTGTGLVTGTVKDAFTGLGLSGVGLQFRAGINATSGTVVATATTGTGGAYSMATLTSGSYTVEASLSGYATGYFTVTVVGGITKANQAGTITPVLASGQTRVVLTWGATPSDLDSHLTGPTATGTRFHVYYSSKGSKVSSPNAALDVDDTSSYGPETTTIYQQSSGVYRFSVHNYSNSGSTSSTVLSASGAQVKVYLASGQSQTFQVPVGKVATLWTVFELNGNTLTPINTMTNANSSSSIQ